MTFPDGFLWGAATAAYQIEGASSEDGRGPTVWDSFCRAGKALHADSGDIAADHYRRVYDDLDLIAELGLTAYRFSVAWTRVQPSGRGRPNQRGLDFYRRLVGGLRDRGVAPVATLHHFDFPQALEDEGGWLRRTAAERFAEYGAIVADALGEDVELWITLNEPWVAAWLGYGSGTFPPCRTGSANALVASHHMLVGHGLAVAAVRASVPAARLGITLGLAPIRAVWASSHDIEAAAKVDASYNRLFLDAILRGAYPEEIRTHYSALWPDSSIIRPADAELIAAPIDFLGVNYYQPRTVVSTRTARRNGRLPAGTVIASFLESDGIESELGAVEVRPADAETTAMGWTIDASGLTELLLWLHRDYPTLPIYVTENGAAFPDYVSPEGVVRDPERIVYLEAHFRAAHAAMERGVDLRGYFVWSLLDNFEWVYGYSKRFGLIFVDYGTQRRVRKESFFWYRNVIERDGLPISSSNAFEAADESESMTSNEKQQLT